MTEDQELSIRELAGENAAVDRPVSMLAACKLLERNPGPIVETGTYRGCGADGESTKLLFQVAVTLDVPFYSIDTSQVAVDAARAHVPGANVICSDSVVWLSAYAGRIGLLYLDSFDYVKGDCGPCQRHQLAEVGAAWGKMGIGSVVVLDDCELQGGGKCGLTNDFLRERGWKEIHRGYQVVWANIK